MKREKLFFALLIIAILFNIYQLVNEKIFEHKVEKQLTSINNDINHIGSGRSSVATSSDIDDIKIRLDNIEEEVTDLQNN
ncbi:hypothetical protein [Arachidicoccus sp.]|uniref:hypothetical protein n=1 Tax=Arachidicoccus sp. TaxID=1872624 RepID=UPI003D21CD85